MRRSTENRTKKRWVVAIAALAVDGPPVEAVGLAPYSGSSGYSADVSCPSTHAPEESLR